MGMRDRLRRNRQKESDVSEWVRAALETSMEASAHLLVGVLRLLGRLIGGLF